MMDLGVAIASWSCFLIFLGCAIWISKRRKPIHFFQGLR